MIIEVERGGHVQKLALEEFESRVRDGDIRPETHIRFEAVTGNSFVEAGTLELFTALNQDGTRQFRQKLSRRGLPLVTAALVGVQLRLHWISWSPSMSNWMENNLVNWAPAILERGEIWRLVTYGALHLDIAHLLFNLCFLAYAGYHLERAVGRLNLIWLFVGSVWSGGLLSMLMAPDRASLGASGGDFGLLAAAVVLGWKYWDTIPRRARQYFGWALVPYILISIVSGVNADNVDNWSHLGGLFGGATLMMSLSPPDLVRRPHQNQVPRGIALLIAIIVSIGLRVAGMYVVPMATHGTDGWTTPYPAYWTSGWTFTGERGWFSPTLDASFSVLTEQRDAPRDFGQLIEDELNRVQTRAHSVEIKQRTQRRFQEYPAEELTISFTAADAPQTLHLLLVQRGQSTYRMALQTSADRADQYNILWKRICRDTAAHPSVAVRKARRRVDGHPRSFQPALALADALYADGDVSEAIRTYEYARELKQDSATVWVGLLRAYAADQPDRVRGTAEQALTTFPDSPTIAIAVVSALSEIQQYEAATQALTDALIRFPEDPFLQQLRDGEREDELLPE